MVGEAFPKVKVEGGVSVSGSRPGCGVMDMIADWYGVYKVKVIGDAQGSVRAWKITDHLGAHFFCASTRMWGLGWFTLHVRPLSPPFFAFLASPPNAAFCVQCFTPPTHPPAHPPTHTHTTHARVVEELWSPLLSTYFQFGGLLFFLLGICFSNSSEVCWSGQTTKFMPHWKAHTFC